MKNSNTVFWKGIVNIWFVEIRLRNCEKSRGWYFYLIEYLCFNWWLLIQNEQHLPPRKLVLIHLFVAICQKYVPATPLLISTWIYRSILLEGKSVHHKELCWCIETRDGKSMEIACAQYLWSFNKLRSMEYFSSRRGQCCHSLQVLLCVQGRLCH